MKKLWQKFAVLAIVLVTITAVFVGCLSDSEKEIVGKYELIEISVSGYPSINAGTYDYFTIEFKSNKKCEIKSKAGGTEYSATADWKVNSDGEIEVITRDGLVSVTEKYTYNDGMLSGTNTTVQDGKSVSISLKLKKIAIAAEE